MTRLFPERLVPAVVRNTEESQEGRRLPALRCLHKSPKETAGAGILRSGYQSDRPAESSAEIEDRRVSGYGRIVCRHTADGQ